ncbi:MAG: L-rhamnose/proton symporter RhaT [Sedimentisphaerales bacterium]|nr:L-rhamnose/proton symporter RhaT [Sedimentisphaerales bacterium]
MNPFFGVFLHAVGGLAAGSFYIPFRRVSRWSWESYWLIQGVAAWMIMPIVIAYLTTPDLWLLYRECSASSLMWSYIFGVLWGVGGLTFGLSMRYLGMSLGYATALGFCAVFGTLVPPMFTGKFYAIVATRPGWVLLAGVAVCLAGIGICGYAGIRKERELTDQQKKQAVREFALMKGFAVAVFAGVMSACMAFAISAGDPIADNAVRLGTTSMFQNNAIYVPAMAGGFTTNVIWCLVLNVRNRTLGDYRRGGARTLARNYAFASLAGVIWYGQFFFYGMGTTQMGEYDFSSWSIHMAFIIVFSNLWGIYFREWKGVRAVTWRAIWAGIGVLVLSTLVIGAARYLKA